MALLLSIHGVADSATVSAAQGHQLTIRFTWLSAHHCNSKSVLFFKIASSWCILSLNQYETQVVQELIVALKHVARKMVADIHVLIACCEF